MSWENHLFTDVIKDVSGGNVKTLQKDYLTTGKIPIVDQGQDLIGGYTNNESSLCKAGNPVIVFGDHTRAVKFIDFDFAMGADGTKILVPRNDDDIKYLFYAINAINLEGAGYSRHFKFLKEKYIPLPPLPEQKRIASILDAADSLRTKRRQAIAMLDELLQAIFLDMFGDPVVNEKGWEVRKVGNICDLINGDRSNKYPSGSDLVDSGILFLSTKNIVNGIIDLTSTQFITEEKFLELGRGKLKPNDLVITLRGTLGSCAVFKTKYNTGFINAQMMIIRCTDKVLPIFIHSLLTSKPFSSVFEKLSRGVAVKQLTAKQISNIKIPLPPLSLQTQFANIVEKVEAQKAVQQAHFAELDILFASLQQRAFAGNL